jgi:putative FmdB family regulatory protein
MPVYEYICRDCGRAFERYVQRWSEAVSCPSCAGAVEKQLSTFSMAGGASSSGGSMTGGSGGGCCGGGGCGCH